MVQEVKDPLELSDYERTLLGKAATRIELPLITEEKGHLLASSDWAAIFDAVAAWVRDGRFEVAGRSQPMLKATEQIEYRTKTLNRELRFIRERARLADIDRRAAEREEKVKAIKSFGIRPVDSNPKSKSSTA